MKTKHNIAVQQLSIALPGSAPPTHLVQLTDLHFGLATPLSLLEAAVEEANACSPDVIALTGDIVSWMPGSLRHVARTLGALRGPKVAVLGNHDHHVGARAVSAALHDAGCLVLRNTTAVVAGISFVGLDDPVTGHDDAEAASREWSGAHPAVGLVHDPRAAPSLWRCGVPLVLAGHTHGGHFDIGRWPERILRSPFVAGLHTTAEGTVYVCPGIGSATFRWRYGLRSRPAIGSLLLS